MAKSFGVDVQSGGLKEQSWQRQLAELEEKLLASRAKWKIVFGHHPPRSNGHHNNTLELIQHVEPLLQVSLCNTFSKAFHPVRYIHCIMTLSSPLPGGSIGTSHLVLS